MLLPWLALAACHAPQAPVLLQEGASFRWVGVNHRLSHLSLDLEVGDALVAVVGGVSSTGYSPPLPDGCDPETCAEYPLVDSADVSLSWARAQVPGWGASGLAHLEVGEEGGFTVLNVPVDGDPNRGGSQVLALLQGLVLDTRVPLTDPDACYAPSNGWLPRRLALALEEPRAGADGRSLEVTVRAAFEAGFSLEEARACLDDAVPDASISLQARVQLLATDTRTQAHGVTWSGAWEQGEDQPDSADVVQPLATAIPGGLAGWTDLEWRFHEEDPELRGAYLRGLGWGALVPQEGVWGWAVNETPVAQLSGFEVSFSGHLLEVEPSDTPVRGTVTARLTAGLDEDQEPVISKIPLEE